MSIRLCFLIPLAIIVTVVVFTQSEFLNGGVVGISPDGAARILERGNRYLIQNVEDQKLTEIAQIDKGIFDTVFDTRSQCVAFRPRDSAELVVARLNGSVNEPLRLQHQDTVLACAFSPVDDTVFVFSHKADHMCWTANVLYHWDLDGQLLAEAELPFAVGGIDVSADGKSILTEGGRVLRILRLKDSRHVSVNAIWCSEDGGYIRASAFSPDGQSVAAVRDSGIEVIDVASGDVLQNVPIPEVGYGYAQSIFWLKSKPSHLIFKTSTLAKSKNHYLYRLYACDLAKSSVTILQSNKVGFPWVGLSDNESDVVWSDGSRLSRIPLTAQGLSGQIAPALLN